MVLRSSERVTGPGQGGYLVITKPWPSMLRTIWGDDERYVQTYFTKWEGRPDLYFPGDGAKRDADGYFWILGRVDDVLNVAGHRIGTMEVESALVDHPAVAEAAVVGRPHEIKGQAIAAFVTLRGTSALECHPRHPIDTGRRPRPEPLVATASQLHPRHPSVAAGLRRRRAHPAPLPDPAHVVVLPASIRREDRLIEVGEVAEGTDRFDRDRR